MNSSSEPTNALVATGTGFGSAQTWRQYGEYVLMAMPYADEVLAEGRGCIVRDIDGKELLDLASGMFCCVLGHNHPKFIERVSQQIHRLLHTGTQFLSQSVFEASYKLAEIAPGRLSKSIFFSTGTEANEFAFRLAKAYTGRTGIVGFARGYYGTSLATKSISSLSHHSLKDSLPLVPESFCLPLTPQCLNCFTHAPEKGCDFPCLDTIEEWLGDWSHIAAIIVEPVLSAGGMLIPPLGYLAKLRRLTQQHGALLIVDEAQTGFGRTGKWFAIEHHDVEPDILTISKSAGNGFPVAGVITSPKIADRVIAKGLWNLSSHQSDPVGAAAVSAVIDIVREDGLIERAEASGRYFMEQLRALCAHHPIIGNVRGYGLMIGFDLLIEDSYRAAQFANDFMYSCRHYGVHLTFGFGNRSFRIIPPLTISRQETDFAIETMSRSLAELNDGSDLREYWPKNPFTSRMWRRRRLSRVASGLWHSSPKQWCEKATRQAIDRFRLGRTEEA